MRSIFSIKLVWVLLLLLGAASTQAERIKDMAQIQGVRTNQLVGYGLVVGLDTASSSRLAQRDDSRRVGRGCGAPARRSG